MQPDSFVLTSESQAEFYRHQPVDFFLYDEEGNANLYILNDNVPGKAHNLILINESEQDLIITGINTAPGPDNYHFELRFRPGTIDPEFHNWITVGSAEWLIQSKLWSSSDPEVASGAIASDTVSLYLVYQLAQTTLVSRTSRLLRLHGLKSGAGGGSRGAKAELRYNLNGDQIATDSNATLHFRQERLEIINQRGVRQIPLEAGFALGNKVLNNGTENSLSLQVTNLLRNSFIPFQGKYTEAPSRLVLSFDTSEIPEYWALFDEDNAFGVSDVIVNGTSTFWHIEKEVQGQTTQWILSPSEPIELDAGESFSIELNKILSSMPTGMANLYLQYENIPGYWDDLFVVPIEKTPFYFEDKMDAEKKNVTKTVVGLGTHAVDPDGAALQIIGGLNADFITGDGAVPTGGIIMWSGAEADVPEGWQLCDGTQNSPDLRSRFIVGAGEGSGLTSYAPKDTGGTEAHTLSENEIPEHLHDIQIDSGAGGISAANPKPILMLTNARDPNTYTGVNVKPNEIANTEPWGKSSPDQIDHRPPFYALAFIIKT